MDTHTFKKMELWFSHWIDADGLRRTRLKKKWSQEEPLVWSQFKDILDLHENRATDLPSTALGIEGGMVRLFQDTNDFTGEALSLDSLDTDDFADPLHLPEIEGFTILEKLGEGGMGAVYKAEKESSLYERPVALKIFKSAFYSSVSDESLIKSELQIHADLPHPNIARFLDAGQSSSGQYFMVMELVKGQDLLEFEKHRLMSVRNKLRLFLQLCDGLVFAHQNRIIHGDLKPSNILVTQDSGSPQIKIIDFGIADVLSHDSEMSKNGSNNIFGTLTYFSPERAQSNYRLSYQADIYALGILLFEFLCGTSLYDQRFFSALTGEAQLALIQNGIESSPSEVLAHQIHRDARYVRQVRGDVDAIVAKAVAKKTEDRYQSVADFRQDIRRFLSHQVVGARETPFLVRTMKFIRRHLVSSLLAAFVFMALSLLAVQARYQSFKTQQDLHRFQSTLAFFEKWIASPHPEFGGSEIKVVDALTMGEANLAKFGAEAPELEAKIRTTLGEIYFGLGFLDKSLEQHQIALKRFQQIGWRRSRDYAYTLDRKAQVLSHQDHLEEAVVLFTQALELRKHLFDSNHPDYLESLLGLATTYAMQGHKKQAAEVGEQALRKLQKRFPPNHPMVLRAQVVLATSWLDGENLKKAIKTLHHVWHIQKGRPETKTFQLLNTQYNLATALALDRQFVEAHRHFEEIVAKRELLLKSTHPQTLNARHGLVESLIGLGRLREAEREVTDLLAIQKIVFEPNHKRILASLSSQATILGELNHAQKAVETLQAIATILENTGRNQSSQALTIKNNLAHYLQQTGRCEEALELLETVSREKISKSGIFNHSSIISLISLADLWVAFDQPMKALPFFETGLHPKAKDHPRRPLIQAMYAMCLMELGHFQEAESLLHKSSVEVQKGSIDQKRIAALLEDFYRKSQ